MKPAVFSNAQTTELDNKKRILGYIQINNIEIFWSDKQTYLQFIYSVNTCYWRMNLQVRFSTVCQKCVQNYLRQYWTKKIVFVYVDTAKLKFRIPIQMLLVCVSGSELFWLWMLLYLTAWFLSIMWECVLHNIKYFFISGHIFFN